MRPSSISVHNPSHLLEHPQYGRPAGSAHLRATAALPQVIFVSEREVPEGTSLTTGSTGPISPFHRAYLPLDPPVWVNNSLSLGSPSLPITASPLHDR